ncbi:hypothetical protein COJ85_32160 [Bacillus sp. AFS076308]|uniref:hypothetical protein n=1 Tax=unclassified Bacillus (in: firmicutes) TaxID=185979 RepID=UPI000BF75D3A|nr:MULTISPECIES: hypothetical protein [unclassified Bacillus (in: firmicutes)]PFN77623.1 hypothetical protein COJ85_32160 [Bacillus sp. AFS076308]PGV45296.1 hypothetical protein COD92_30760 [Bacillus sp. AFS037270]
MKDFFSKLLTGMSIGIVCALIPNALLGEILKLFILSFAGLTEGGWSIKNITIMLSTFYILPIILNLGLIYLFAKKLK